MCAPAASIPARVAWPKLKGPPHRPQAPALPICFATLNAPPCSQALPGQHLRRLTALQRLSCSSCSFASVPDELGSLAALEHLSLDDNNLVELPRSLGTQ